jgi:hypothetical protein
MLNFIEVEDHVIIDDAYIDQLIKNNEDPLKIINPLQWQVSIYDGEERYINDLSKFSVAQKYLFAIDWYIIELNNGGHHQFYANSTGIVYQDALDGFKVLKLNEFYDILQESIMKFKTVPSKDRISRQEQLRGLSTKDFYDLDKKFYTILNPEMNKNMLDYINNNRSSFYFDGIIKRKVLKPRN